MSALFFGSWWNTRLPALKRFARRLVEAARRWLRQGWAAGNLDRRLVYRLRTRDFPTARQFRYLLAFLSRPERTVLLVALFLMVVSLSALAGRALARQLVRIPAPGGEYREALVGQPRYLNPLFAMTSEVDSDLTYLLYRGLFSVTRTGGIRPELAESYTVSADQKVYDITLRSGARWSDGAALDAADVMFTWELIQNPEVGSPLYNTFQGVRLETIGPRQLRFTLPEPFAAFPAALTVGILPEHLWGDLPPSNIRLAKYNLQPVGAGRWRFNKLIKDKAGNIQSYTLAPNEYAAGATPYLNTLTFKFFTSPEEAGEALRSRSVDGVNFIAPSRRQRLTESTFITRAYRLPQYTALFFNAAGPAALSSRELRTALALALNKTALRPILGPEAELIDAPLPKEFPGWHPSLRRYPFNQEEALARLDKLYPRIEPEEYFRRRQIELLKLAPGSGRSPTSTPAATTTPEYQELVQTVAERLRTEMDPGQPFYRVTKEGAWLRLTLTTVDTWPERAVAEAVARDWRAMGIAINVKLINPRHVLRDILKNHDYEILLYGELLGADPDLFPFWHSSQREYPGLNLSQLANRAADKLLEEARRRPNPEPRGRLYQEFQDLLAAELPAIFLYTPRQIFMAHQDIKGIPPMEFMVTPTHRFEHLSAWYVNTRLQWRRD